MRIETHWIKSGNYKGGVTKDGVEYIQLYKLWQRPLHWAVKRIQKTLWYCGIAIYDPIFGECTPDFNCCCDIGRKRFIHIHPIKKPGAVTMIVSYDGSYYGLVQGGSCEQCCHRNTGFWLGAFPTKDSSFCVGYCNFDHTKNHWKKISLLKVIFRNFTDRIANGN